ncbi:MAG: hypothetical protein FJX99_09905, partial [Bacteroidetes bacterium]|nr:hypothetical protein [Bacteroidota bacterium]
MYVSGLTYKKSLNEKTYISATLSGSREEQHTRHEYLHRSLVNLDSIVVDSSYQMLGYDFRTMKLSGYFAVNHKINKQHLVKAGINFDVMSFNLLDSVLN